MTELIVSYIAGYLYSLVIGTCFIWLLAVFTGKAIGEFPEKMDTNGRKMEYHRWTAAMVGATERLLYTSAILLGQAQFIAVWLVLKVASQWRRWGEKDSDDKKDVYRERANFNSYLVNTGLSLAYGILGGAIINWWSNKNVSTAVAFALGLVLLNIVFIGIAYYQYRQSIGSGGEDDSTTKQLEQKHSKKKTASK